MSTSFITVLPRDEQDIVRAKVKSIIKSDPLLTGRDMLEFPYTTELHLFGKKVETSRAWEHCRPSTSGPSLLARADEVIE